MSSDDVEPENKRPRTEEESPNFELEFTEATTLRRCVEIASQLLKEIDFEVCDGPDFTGLQIRCIDTRQICLVISKVTCKVIKGTGHRFTVNAGLLATCLRGIPPSFTLALRQSSGDSDLHIIAKAGNENADDSEQITYHVPTLVTGEAPPDLSSLSYSFSLTMDLAIFRQLCKQAKDFNAEHTTFEIAAATEKCNQQQLIIRATGNASFERVFAAVAESEADAIEALNVSFSNDYLLLMLKSMEKGSIILRLSANQPLLLSHCLDGEQSIIHFVLAPKCED